MALTRENTTNYYDRARINQQYMMIARYSLYTTFPAWDQSYKMRTLLRCD